MELSAASSGVTIDTSSLGGSTIAGRATGYVPPVAAPPAKTGAPETEVEEGYKMAKLSGYMHFSNEHRADVTTLVNAMEGLAVRERQQRIMTELGKMWKALPEADRVSWKERAPIVKQKIKAKKKREVTGLREELASLRRTRASRPQLPRASRRRPRASASASSATRRTRRRSTPEKVSPCNEHGATRMNPKCKEDSNLSSGAPEERAWGRARVHQ